MLVGFVAPHFLSLTLPRLAHASWSNPYRAKGIQFNPISDEHCSTDIKEDITLAYLQAILSPNLSVQWVAWKFAHYFPLKASTTIYPNKKPT